MVHLENILCKIIAPFICYGRHKYRPIDGWSPSGEAADRAHSPATLHSPGMRPDMRAGLSFGDREITSACRKIR